MLSEDLDLTKCFLVMHAQIYHGALWLCGKPNATYLLNFYRDHFLRFDHEEEQGNYNCPTVRHELVIGGL